MAQAQPFIPDDLKEEDCLNILVATDIHLGYDEKSPVLGNDTFRTLEEILQIAKENEVDFILLGGDLFHHSQPSTHCINQCITLMKKYCLGDRPVQIEYLSDQAVNFQHSANPIVNYEDQNQNIEIPIFSIHGNHDDPVGVTQTSALDLFASAGLINYFGKWLSHEEVKIDPILLRKGETALALYGLSHIQDERLGRMFMENKVKIRSPQNQEDFFHLLVWHQNRAARGVKNFIPDESLPDFLDLVIWGHEHDCRILPEEKNNGVFVSQPGSSVATSLAQGESIEKKVGLLKIHKRDFQMVPISLKTVRPFVFKILTLTEPGADQYPQMIRTNTDNLINETINDLIEEANYLDRVKMKPLIRLMVKYHNEHQVCNAIRFGQKYTDRVANPESMLKFSLITKHAKKRPANGVGINGEDSDEETDRPGVAAQKVEDLIDLFLEDKLPYLSINALKACVSKSVANDDFSTLQTYAKEMHTKYLDRMMQDEQQSENADEIIANLTEEFEPKALDEALTILNKSKKRTNSGNGNDMRVGMDDDSSDDDDAPVPPVPATPKTGRGSRGGKGSRGGRAARNPRGARK